MDSLHWLSHLSSLETLILSGIDLHKQTNWLHSFASFSNSFFCGLRGRIPDLSGYQELEWLILSNNELDGSIPDWSTGEVPPSIGSLLSLRSLDLHNNGLLGHVPSSFQNCKDLSYGNECWASKKTLRFDKTGEKKNFRVVLEVMVGLNKSEDFVFGKLIWTDGKHRVRSRIVVSQGDSFYYNPYFTFNRSMCCNEKDQRALLMFKQGVVDPSNRLSSWSSQEDCCEWLGVACDTDTGRVTMLDLQNINLNESESLRGEINLSLLQLEFLNFLDLSFNDFESVNDSVIANSYPPANISKLEQLTLKFNHHLHIDNLQWLSPLSSLVYLDLSGIDLHKQTNWLQSIHSFSSLIWLYMNNCQLTNIQPSVENVNFSSLVFLDLGENDFYSELPNWLFNLSNDFKVLNLSNCGLRGQIPDLSRYRDMESLDLSNNKLRGSLPKWLGQFNDLDLDLSNNLFYGSIPSSFGNISASSLDTTSQFLALSHNSISGDLSNLSLTSEFIFMSFNNLKGGVPRISKHVNVLDLSHNSISGHLYPALCHTEYENNLVYLDISDNFLTGELPDCWTNWTKLSYIYLGNNKLTGEVPPTMSSLLELKSLDLHNNGFYGDIPRLLQNCTALVLINLERNDFFGSIPNWMQQNISIVKLRSNQLTGNIPPQLCNLSNLTVLDLADNKLSGSIPHCLYNLTSLVSGFPNNSLKVDQYGYTGASGDSEYRFKIMLYTKGQNLEYSKNLELVRSIDLSANKLSGEIPPQLFFLVKMQSLNLSYNHLTGKIPEEIGMMKDMESLNFSHNKLQGEIPQSISGLSFLSDLNVSYNNFIGQIPLGTQLQSFDVWSYIGNPELCGAPLIKNCTKQEKPNQKELAREDEDDNFLRSLYLGMGVGFAMGFWVVCGSIFCIRAMRHRFFRWFDGVVDRIYRHIQDGQGSLTSGSCTWQGTSLITICCYVNKPFVYEKYSTGFSL
ncbi:receptor-like protein EIX2 [Senna tora]|uniref:Receptor-like protein EIX2 n=1 Tax=Senna tora TaxID=362788 RepID=A0A834WDY1_9FABA|nr:receptor-like protein EIX2 [Senna tora]